MSKTNEGQTGPEVLAVASPPDEGKTQFTCEKNLPRCSNEKVGRGGARWKWMDG